MFTSSCGNIATALSLSIAVAVVDHMMVGRGEGMGEREEAPSVKEEAGVGYPPSQRGYGISERESRLSIMTLHNKNVQRDEPDLDLE